MFGGVVEAGDGGFWAECVGMWDFFCNFAGVI
jgi:hypothetical protein